MSQLFLIKTAEIRQAVSAKSAQIKRRATLGWLELRNPPEQRRIPRSLRRNVFVLKSPFAALNAAQSALMSRCTFPRATAAQPALQTADR